MAFYKPISCMGTIHPNIFLGWVVWADNVYALADTWASKTNENQSKFSGELLRLIVFSVERTLSIRLIGLNESEAEKIKWWIS